MTEPHPAHLPIAAAAAVRSTLLPPRRVEEGLPLLRNVMGNHVKEEGRALVNDPEKVSCATATVDVQQQLVRMISSGWHWVGLGCTVHLCEPGYTQPCVAACSAVLVLVLVQ
jgi:hypothetical protein